MWKKLVVSPAEAAMGLGRAARFAAASISRRFSSGAGKEAPEAAVGPAQVRYEAPESALHRRAEMRP